VVDGQVIPDPRSAQQREGIEGWSELVDHHAFAWTDGGWTCFPLEQALIYELHVGTFSAEGTFAGVIAHIDHLIGLGVNAIEVMPVATFPGARGWGYDGVGLFAAQWTYGGSDGLKQLVDACHARGLAVILDVVYNHLGPSGNHLHKLGPYFTPEHHTPWGEAINFDGAGSGPVRQFVIDNALMWIREHHVDGLRLDAVHAIIDTSSRHILEDIGSAVHAAGEELGRTTWVIAESDLNDPKLVASRAFRRVRPRRGMERRLPPRVARHAHRRAGRVLLRLLRARRPGHRPGAGLRVHRSARAEPRRAARLPGR
jgi:maltooligosyltrehalose trehalohydrolase